MMKYFFFVLLSVTLSAYSCNQPTSKQRSNKPAINADGSWVKKTYYKDGSLKSEITVKDKKKNGIAKKYYTTGELHTTVNYVNNIKEGETVWYYKNGQPYRVTPYKKGKIDGIRKIYYEDGTLQAEIPYKDGELIEGTKEYEKNGKRIINDTKIIIKPNDLIKFEHKYILNLTLSNNSKRVKFYQEKTSTAGNDFLFPIQTKNGIGKIEYFLPPGAFEMTILKISARYKTRLGNPVLLSTTYNLAIENK